MTSKAQIQFTNPNNYKFNYLDLIAQQNKAFVGSKK